MKRPTKKRAAVRQTIPRPKRHGPPRIEVAYGWADADMADLTERLNQAAAFTFEPALGKELYEGSSPEKPTTVIIDVDATRARAAVRQNWDKKQKVQTRRDGSVRMTFMCDDFAPLIAWVLRFGSHATVIRPAALAESVGDQLRAAARQYRTTGKVRGRSRPRARTG